MERMLLYGIVPPLVAALLLVSIAGRRLVPLAMAVGVFVAYGLLKQWPADMFRSPSGLEWLVWGLVAAGVLASLEHLRVVPARVAPVAGFALAGLLAWAMLRKVGQRWSTAEIWLHVVGAAAAIVASLLATRAVLARAPAQRPPGAVLPAVVFTTVLSLDAGLCMLAHFALAGQLGGAVAAALGAAAGTVWWRRSFALGVADGTWIGVAHMALLLAAVHLGDRLPWSAVGVAAVAPLCLLLVPRALAERPWRWFALALPLAAAPLAVALWLAAAADDAYGY